MHPILSRLRWPAVATAILVAAGTVGTARAPQAGSEKSIYVMVTDAQTNKPVTGLPASAFAIREDNIDRDVVRVAPLTEPMSVILLADTTSAMVPVPRDLRVATGAFIKRFLTSSPTSSLALWEFGGADIPVENFTSDAAKLEDATNKLFPKGTLSDLDQVAAGSAVPRGQNIVGSNLIEALAGASKQLAKRPEARRIILAFHSDLSVESNGVTGQQAQNEVEKANVSVVAVSMQAQVANGPQRDNVLDGVCPYSGGRRITILGIQALAATLENASDILTSQYVVTYSRPSGSAKQVLVGTRLDLVFC